MDYNILFFHLPNSFFSYLFHFTALQISISYILYMYIYKYRYIFISVNYFGIISVINCVGSGALWGWSQWGSVPIIDFKISLMFVFIVFFTTCYLYINVVSFYHICWYCIYISYLIPLLKYQVFWFSDIHQQYSIHFLNIYINSFYLLLLCFCTFNYLSFYICIHILNKSLN
jgi:hypothetical protein